ncbi:ABC-three component system middle component 4 [Chitinophaga silvisoli]|uniref:Uncharacterized protein n=1 Tax=Chitinophaga silvisoli TaxID=2291814 RepID=A0A3E1P2Q7_9BACT|nr:ABC-three component system middle component 4 [Chitinophaga silvisoli]RFM34471.1 hypothetical protein DXN04_14435 [Chitinophaga silvisoli]
MALSFIYPDKELDIQIIRLLIILKHNSTNRANNPILSLDKISAFVFLIEHPYILFRILIDMEKRSTFVADEIEQNSISTKFPNTYSLHSFSETKEVLKIMIARKFANVSLVANIPYYTIAENGVMYLESIETSYTDRLHIISGNLSHLSSESYKDLLNLIKPYTYGK